MNVIKAFFSFSIYNNGKDVSITIGTIAILLAVLFGTNFILKLIRTLVTKKLKAEDRFRFKTVFTFIRYIVLSIVIVGALDTSGVKVTALLAASTALFVGIGLGMQKLFQDIISGVFILVDKTITVNDVVEIENKIGKITQVGLRTTKAVTNDDKILVIPNHKFLSEILYNWTQNNIVTREFVEIGVAYGTDVNLVKSLLLDIASQEPAILKEPKSRVLFEDFGDSALKFKLHFYITDSFNVVFVKSDLRYKIYEVFKQNNIQIPFPQRDIHIINT